MERRRQRWDDAKRSQKKWPPRGTCIWLPTVPQWEKEFCKVVGSLDWKTLLHMKKFTHLYENVNNWDDSAGEEALAAAKKRYWAGLKGLWCHLPPPDPDMYIDEIDWELSNGPEPDIEAELASYGADGAREPVIIFGDSLLANQSYSLAGWGGLDEEFGARSDRGDGAEEKFEARDNDIVPPSDGGDGLELPIQSYSQGGWGGVEERFDAREKNVMPCDDWGLPNQSYSRSGWGDVEENFEARDKNIVPRSDECDGWGLPRQSYLRGGWGDVDEKIEARDDWGPQAEKRPVATGWDSFESCVPSGHRAAIAVGRTWQH